MIWAILAFAFAALGSKVLLGLWCVWVLLPTEHECSRCDGETSPIESRPGLRTVARWANVQSRWCARCGETFLARGGRPPRLFIGAPARPASDAPDGAPATPASRDGVRS